MYKAEQILRSDYARHFLLMFFAVSVLMWAVTLPMWALILIVVIMPIIWEVVWVLKRHVPIEILDVLLSIAGGVVALLIH